MSQRMYQSVVALIALGLIGMGIFYLVAPQLAVGLTGGFQLDNNAIVDVRATYGGIQIGLGCALLMLLRVDKLSEACLVLAVVILPVGVIRAAAYLLSDGVLLMHFGVGVGEIALGGLAVFIARANS